jgi:ATP-dependent DNA ligase
LEKHFLPKLVEPIRYSPELKADLPQLMASVKSVGLEGLVAKRRKSRYGPPQRSGAWRKMQINRGKKL